MEIKYYTLNEIDIQQIANQVKDLVIDNLAIGGNLNGLPEEVGAGFVVVVKKKNLFGKFIERIFPSEKENSFEFLILKTGYKAKK